MIIRLFNSPRDILRALALVGLAFMLTACHSSVRFQPHAPYNSPRRYAEPLIIVHPDDIDTVRESAHVGTFIRPRKFRVYYGEALKWESVARFGGMFSNVFLVTESAYNALQTEEGRESVDLYSIPESLIEPSGYVLVLSRVRFQFAGGRALYLTDVSFSNRETGEELFRGTMRGRGTAITVRDDTEFMTEDITQAVISANTSLFNPLAERIRRAIAEQPPRAERQRAVPPPPEPVETPSEPEEQTDSTPPPPPPHPRLRPFFSTPE